ncbi:protein TASOR 2 isoform X3 [Rana temporaria]|uniref:protein TASOR 2 isoform X3 n=1 Tax=Rana temporaria TaxID=8407 RepID=UPI001AAD9CD5|nr:protein TASOR 2 isoform X3 [Rana temporaria]
MPVLKDPDMHQLNNTELYNVWKGELYIQEQRACNIKFKSSGSCSIPVQLPNKLEIKEAIKLSQLRKALPVQIFDQISFTGQEGCFESIYYTLYAVKSSSIDGFDIDKLLEWMKDQELALIKVLHDQGLLILLTSSALQCSEGLSVKDSFQLFALFLFPNSRLLDNTGSEDLGYKLVKEDISLKITELLPGLQYAILETRQMQKGKDLYPDTLVEKHFKQFASLQGKNFSVGELKAGTSNRFLLSGHGKDIADQTDQLFFSRLQSYISSPVNFSVPLVKMSSLLKEEIPLSSDSEKCGKNVIGKDSVALESKTPLLAANNIKSDGSSGNHVLNENKKQPAKKRSFKKGGRRGARKGKRKLKHQTASPSSATSENQVASKKRKLIGGDQEQAVSSNRTTVKLASAPLAHRRKRGAEVLTAEFVIDDKVSETETTVANKKSQEKGAVLKNKLITGKARKKASTDTHVVRDRPPKRKASDPGNRKKFTEVKAKSETAKRPVKKDKGKSGKQSKKTTVSINNVPFEAASSFSKTSMDHNLTINQSAHLAPVPETDIMEKRISMYESHALNLLADLALNSLSSSSISYINSENTSHMSETVVQEKVPDSDGGNAVEYPQNNSPPLQSSSASEEPVQPKAGGDTSPSQQRTENTEKPSSHKMLLAAAKAKARNNTTSKICLEHSYSQLPRDDAQDKSTKDPSEKPSPCVSEPTSPEIEEVLDQSSDFLIPREFLHLTGDIGCPSLYTKPRDGSRLRDNFYITFKWEAKYDFDLDSKFTSDPLEKTVNRALHGPWNPNLKEKVEDVKIILHMWLALFYSKPSQPVISCSRKVVEHSNPAKYVSINTVHDPLCEIVETDIADAENGDESDLLRNSPRTPPRIMSGVSPAWHEMKEKHSSHQPVDLSVASKMQTKADSKESEHEFSKHSSSAEKTQMSIDSEKGFSMLHEDLCSTVSKNAENDMPVSPEPVSRIQVETFHDETLSLTSDGNQQTTTRTEVIPHEHTSVTSSTIDKEVSPSGALNINSTSNVFHEDDGHSDHSDTEEEILKKRNPLVPQIQNVSANAEQHESVLESVGDRDLLEAKLQGVNVDLAVGQHNKEKEQDTSNVHLGITNSNGSKLGLCEENNQTKDLKSSSFRENLSPLKSLKYGSNASPLKDGKALESGIRLNDDKRLTLQRPNTSRIFLEFVHREKSSMPSGSQDRAKNNIDLLAENTKKVDSCTVIECNDGKASIIDLKLAANSDLKLAANSDLKLAANSDLKLAANSDLKLAANSDLKLAANGDLKLTANSVKEATTSSSTNEVLGKRSDEQEECQNEPLPAKKDTNDIAPFGNMGKLELSPSSSDISDIEDLNTDKTVEETLHTDKNPDLVDTSSEAPVAAFHQGDDGSPENDQSQVNRNTVAIQITHHSTDINETDKTEENLPVQSPSQPCDIGADKIDNLTTVSEDFQEKDTEAVDIYLQPIEVEDISEADDSEYPLDDIETPCDQEVGPLISVETLGEDGETDFVEKPLSYGSEASKFVDSESLGEKASLLGSDSSRASDLECISVFEKLSLKAAEEIFTTPISTLAKEQELQIHGIEILPADEEIMDNNPSVVLLQTDLDTEDHMVPNIMEIGNSCEVLQAPEAMDEVTPAITVVETIQDSGGATNEPVSTCVDTGVDELMESQSDSTSDVSLSPCKSEKSTKDPIQIKRNRLRKEILSRLKLICRGSGIGQHASSNSEDEIIIVHEKPGKKHTEEHTEEQTDTKIEGLSKDEINTVNLVDSTSENQTLELDILEEEIVQEIAENNSSISLTESLVCQEAEQPASQEKCVSPLRDDFTDHMDQDSGQNQSEICCILNTGSISKEQYDRWSETSDDDIEFVRAYKEPLAHKTSKPLQKESHEFPSPSVEVPTPHSEPSRSRKEKHSKRNSGSNASRRETGEHAPRYHRDPDYSSPRRHKSFIITKKLRDAGRTRPTVHKESIHGGRSDYDSLFANRRMVSSDLTQNTIDMEHLRFMCKLKEVLRKSSTDLHVFEPPFQTMFESRRILGCPRSRTKSISPLLITVRCTPHRRDYRGHDGLFPSSSYNQAYEGELRDKPTYSSRTPKKVRTCRYSPYHFNRLRHESSLEKPNSDISVIIRECTQSNHLKLSRVGLGGTPVERTSACSAPEESDRQLRQTFDRTSTKSKTVGNIISDLCTNLRSRLHGIARESTQTNSYFYLGKTNVDQDNDKGDDFFSLTKSLLIKDGYTPIEPRDFCDSEQEESKKLLVIIRNENVSSEIHKIPCLLQLRLLPNVTFAGVDTPEDLPESMYQELLQSGGFVVSDRAVLENTTIDKLKEVLTILEKLSRTSAWKWLIHYGDYRKLKEDKRAESASRVKIPLLKSYQQSNIIEILPYHRCDSRSKEPSSDIDCVLSLQSQHIRSRLAVFLTVMPSTEAEKLEQNGILVYDVDTFIRRIQKVDVQLQPSVWS